jgi:hypothetical protein
MASQVLAGQLLKVPFIPIFSEGVRPNGALKKRGIPQILPQEL